MFKIKGRSVGIGDFEGIVNEGYFELLFHALSRCLFAANRVSILEDLC